MSTLPDDWVSFLTAVPAFFALFAVTIVYTPKDASLNRLSAFAALLALNVPIWRLTVEVMPTMVLKGAVGTLTWCATLSAGELLFVSRAAKEDLIYEGEERVGKIALLYRASCLYFNLRRVGTKWEVKDLSYNIPKSRWGFVGYKMCTVTMALLIMDLAVAAPPPEARLMSGNKQSLWDFRGFTVEDVVFRLVTTTFMWVMGANGNYLILHTMAPITVALGLSKPEAWPRVHGASPTNLTSIRGFWSVVWHQTLRKTLTGWGDYISDNALCLRRGTIVSRYMRLFLAFFISGALHHAMDITWGNDKELLSIVFFSMQALGIMMEDAVQAATKSWPIPGRVRSVVGFLWLWAFMWWTAPRWFYGNIRHPEANRPIVLPPFA